MTKVDVAFLIGRFQPFHNGHKHLIDFGLQHAKRVVVLVGGSNKARSYKNPFTYEERATMIRRCFDTRFAEQVNFGSPSVVESIDKSNVVVKPLPDVPGNDDAWLGNVYSAIHEAMPHDLAGRTGTFGVIGYKKDKSSYYLDLFPNAEQFLMEEGFATLSATEIREHYFQKAPVFPTRLVPDAVMDYLEEFYQTDAFRYVLAEREWIDDYKASWANSPFPPTFVTSDCVCTQMGHVLLVTRGDFPGKGQLALPGGFVEAKKGDSYQNALWELWEETQIKDQHGRIPRGKLGGFFTGDEQRFDDPDRSVRGFTLTTAFRFKFPDGKSMFKVKGGDDAADARWYPVSYIRDNPQLIFEDHWDIMNKMGVFK